MKKFFISSDRFKLGKGPLSMTPCSPKGNLGPTKLSFTSLSLFARTNGDSIHNQRIFPQDYLALPIAKQTHSWLGSAGEVLKTLNHWAIFNFSEI